MTRSHKTIVLLLFSLLLLSAFHYDWGFFAHKRINRMAVFTLPPDMMVFYKKNIEYLTNHAVDADKRRYATKHEAVRHYIDLDHWGEYPFENLPRNWNEVLMKFTKIYVVNSRNDTLPLFENDPMRDDFRNITFSGGLISRLSDTTLLTLPYEKYRSFFFNNILGQYYEDDWKISCDSLKNLFGNDLFPRGCNEAFAVDHFSGHGILPYHLVSMQRRLTKAFETKDEKLILRLSADMGHYIGDAHVPLHTTKNYNGQLTGQLGIHAFWESRIPELFADAQYDYFVGKAQYIENPDEFFWNIVLSSNALVDSVLLIEKDLSKSFAEDQQFCFDLRGDITIRTQCRAYAEAYHNRMKGMVESRMKGSMLSIGSAWFTAWVDAGQPDLSDFTISDKDELLKVEAEEEAAQKAGSFKVREHDQ